MCQNRSFEQYDEKHEKIQFQKSRKIFPSVKNDRTQSSVTEKPNSKARNDFQKPTEEMNSKMSWKTKWRDSDFVPKICKILEFRKGRSEILIILTMTFSLHVLWYR